MSRCDCDNPKKFRVTGEIFEEEEEKLVRVRCKDCSGKFGTIPARCLESFGIDQNEVRPGNPISPPIEIEIDLR